jgi:plastocyanin
MRGVFPRAMAGVGLITLTLMFGACGKSSSPSASPSPSTPTGSPTVTGMTVRQGAKGYTFDPASLTVKTGDTITVTNVSSVPITHTFTISGKGIDVVNVPGQSHTITISLAPGTYRFICRFHLALGMKGTLTVTG